MRRIDPNILLVPVLLILGLLVALPAAGYTVILNDGTEIVTRDAPRVEGDKAYVTLPSGTVSVLDAAEINFEKTREVNQVDLGTARLIDGKKTQTLPAENAFEEEDDTLGGLISRRPGGLTLPEPRSRNAARGEESLPLTTAGFVDLREIRRRPYEDTDVIAGLQGYLQGQGVDGARIYRGTEPDRPFLEIPANSEASVFKVLRDAANALVQAHEQFPKKVAALELLLVTDAQVRGGQFVLTPEQANDLVSGKIDGPTFFYRHVQF